MKITGYTQLIGIIADPIRHSLSPMMHNACFEYLNLDYVYLAFETEALKETIEGLKAIKARGWNVSMPYKKRIIPYLDEISLVSQLSDSVNTVINDQGYLKGTSTDGLGWKYGLKEKNISIQDKTLVLLGAGGAATAIMAQGAIDGLKEIYVFKRKNQTWSQIQERIEHMMSHTNTQIILCDIEDKELLKEKISDADILTNATDIGMSPHDKECLIDREWLHKDLTVFDCIYHPLETLLLQYAKEKGCMCISGLSMLLYQGAVSFELWTNRKMPIDIARKAIGI
ncbi:shikimate 5-dehydrogenase [Eggerthia catenaformis OT 569 = DSM 20559]|uniref:Shikimate dehydrogenase (NADP(+)) n=1 Tax=Eggerthia catenaformis OT 569 = DSM 20559 TaxID=999415 RepID=M2Q3S4_9FIRM|nr:shikimate dehydrogenase [Eggerthia catenaformis]EMD17515.1 shikimate 5-dehydrogenase [Eggerthia catenaformis OT 569 = DSM 20559]